MTAIEDRLRDLRRSVSTPDLPTPTRWRGGDGTVAVDAVPCVRSVC